MHYQATLPPGVDFDTFRDRLQERVAQALDTSSGISIPYRTEIHEGKECLRVTLTGKAHGSAQELRRQQDIADTTLEREQDAGLVGR